MRFGLFLLVLTLLVSLVGSLIPQQEDYVFYFEMYGRSLAPVLLKLGLNNLFHSRWFAGLAIILCLNLMACTMTRSRGLFTRMFGIRVLNSADQMKQCQRYRELAVQGVGTDQVAGELKEMLKSNRYQVLVRPQGESRVIAARRDTLGHFGSPLLHLALVVIIAGSILGGLYGKSVNYQAMVPGELHLTRDGFPFDLKIRDFRIDYYPDGKPSQYRSNLSAVAGGNILTEKNIAVNDPLDYQGVKIYQSSYGWMITGNIHDGKNRRSFTVEDGGLLNLPGPGDLALEVHFLPDYRRDEQGRPFSKSLKPLNPKIVYILTSQGRPFNMGEASLGQTVAVGGMDVNFERYHNFTGLIVKKDPGVPVVWTGFILLLIGLCLCFYLRPRCVWAILHQKGDGVAVYLASEGLSRPDGLTEDEFEVLVNRSNLKYLREISV